MQGVSWGGGAAMQGVSWGGRGHCDRHYSGGGGGGGGGGGAWKLMGKQTKLPSCVNFTTDFIM